MIPSKCTIYFHAQEKDGSSSANFLQTMDVLTRGNVEAMEKSLERAKLQTGAVVTQVTSFIDMNQIISAGPFLYAFVIEVSQH